MGNYLESTLQRHSRPQRKKSEFLKRSRKSIGRRVSFAATARIRMFERDDKEDEHAKTMSFLEGNKAQVNPNNIPFTFQSSSQDNDTNNTASSMESSGPSQDNQEDENTQNTQASTGSSDSEKERSFEVNVAHGYSDTTSGSSEANNGLYLQSLLPAEGLGNFDDMGHSSDSSSDDDVNYFPDAHLMKRSSGVGIFEGDQDADLGPQVEIGQANHSLFSQQLDHLDDGTGDMSLVSEDYSMDFKFQRHRSSLPGRQPTSFGGDDRTEDSTAEFSNNLQLLAAHAASSSAADSQGLPDLGSVTDIVNEAMMANARQSLDMLDEQIPGDEDTDMDITAPIGTGIQELAHEMPPMAFHTAEDHTAMFSEFGSQMDMTQTIGVGILETDLVAPSTQDETASQLGTPMDMTQPIGAGIVEVVQIATSTQEDSASEGEKTKDVDSIIDINATLATPRRQSFNSRASLRASFGATDVTIDQPRTAHAEGSEQHEKERRQPPFNEPVFQAPQISPATTNLAKKIDRFSVGEPSGSASGPQEDDPYNTMDFLREQRARRAIVGALMDGGDISRDNTNDFTNEFTNDHSLGAPGPEAADVSYDAGGDEDSISELPPISLSQFLGLVGISFLDQLYTSTRRRTIPHQSSSSESYRSADLIKAKAIFTQELNSYREACRLLKQSIEKTRAFCVEQEKKVMESNPDYFREFRESNADTKEFMKDRLKLVKSHAKLDTSVQFSGLKSELLERQQASLEEHLDKLKKDIANLGQLASELSKEKAKVMPRHAELKRIVEQATARRRAYAQCDKEQLRMLTEAVDEQGTQIEHFKSVNERKEKELAEVRARVAQLRLSEQTSKERVAAAEKTIQDNQYVRPEDVSQAKDRLNIIQATHRWEPLRSSSESFSSAASGSAFMVAKAGSSTLEFVYDKAVVVVIDPSKIGKDSEAVKVSAFEEEAMVDFDLSLADQQRLHISALACKTRPSMKDYFPLLRDYTSMVAAKYKSGTTISKILSDVSQFWTRICLIRRDIELVRAHHVVDLVAGSAENLKELELNASPQTSRKSFRQITPVVLLDIRVRFTGPILGASARRRVPEQSSGGKKNGHQSPEEEPVKFYLWFTFTLSDLLSFPGPNSFTWRLEIVYGDISPEHVAQAVSPSVKKGGYDVMRDICLKVNQLLKT
ncbi:MAG: Spc7 kinetochore protein-domain-containing protein [Linnemannia elongata]|nr:MAG: Spc7 kinetochore protein-domain-containing protein [Linnemannia elongata]